MKVFDLHCDTLSELRRAEMRGDGQTFAHNNGHIDLEKLEKGDYMLQCLSLIHIWDITVSPNNGIKSGSTALGKPA